MSVHQALEKELVLKIKRIKTKEDYGVLLRMMYGFYAPLEKRIEALIPAHAGLQLSSRRKASLILRDLSSMGMNAQVSVCRDLPVISSYPQVLGVLYVLEGSTLGGTVISGIIGRQLGPSAENALGFFRGYRGKTVQMWEEFKRHLLCPFSEEDQVSMIVSAHDTFLTFKQWVEKND